MVTGTDGGYHETGTKTPKISFYETYKDEAGKSRRRVHTHTWQWNLVHKCVQEQAPVIYSVVTGDAIQMQRFSPKQLDELKMMASTNIPKPCLYRIMLNMNPGVTWDYQTFISQVKTLRRQLKNEAPNPFLQLEKMRDEIISQGGTVSFDYDPSGDIDNVMMITPTMKAMATIYNQWAVVDGTSNNRDTEYTVMRLNTLDCFDHTWGIACVSSHGGETAANVTKLITETGLAGKLTISSDMGSAMAHLQASGLAMHRDFCSFHKVDSAANVTNKAEDSKLKERVAQRIKRTFGWKDEFEWMVFSLQNNLALDFPTQLAFLQTLCTTSFAIRWLRQLAARWESGFQVGRGVTLLNSLRTGTKLAPACF